MMEPAHKVTVWECSITGERIREVGNAAQLVAGECDGISTEIGVLSARAFTIYTILRARLAKSFNEEETPLDARLKQLSRQRHTADEPKVVDQEVGAAAENFRQTLKGLLQEHFAKEKPTMRIDLLRSSRLSSTDILS